MAKKRKTGRPRKLEANAQRRVVLSALRKGATLIDAAGLAKASYRTLHDERTRDAAFAADIAQAELEGKMRLVTRAGEKKPDWLLAVRYPDEYARKDRYTLAQISEALERVLAKIVPLVAEDKRELANQAMQDEILGLVIRGGEVPENGGGGSA